MAQTFQIAFQISVDGHQIVRPCTRLRGLAIGVEGDDGIQILGCVLFNGLLRFNSLFHQMQRSFTQAHAPEREVNVVPAAADVKLAGCIHSDLFIERVFVVKIDVHTRRGVFEPLHGLSGLYADKTAVNFLIVFLAQKILFDQHHTERTVEPRLVPGALFKIGKTFLAIGLHEIIQ